MRPTTLHTLIILGSLMLMACGAQTQDDPQDDRWCVDESECADAAGGDDAGADAHVDDHEDVGPDAPDDEADAAQEPDVEIVPDADDEDGGDEEERPVIVPTPTGLDGATQLVVHRDTACALVDSSPVCWGDNTYGQAQPPEDVWGDRLVLTGRFGCVISGPGGLQCWGDGVDDIANGISGHTNHTILGRHTIYGASAHEGRLCYSFDYTESAAAIECVDSSVVRRLGPTGAVAVDVRHDQAFAGIPSMCYALVVEGGYAYQCMHGGAVIEVTTSLGDWGAHAPQIEHDGNGQVAVRLADGDIEWYELALEFRAEPGVRQATRIEVDWGEWREEFVAKIDTSRLLSPNCVFFANYPVVCRDRTGARMEFVVRQSSPLAAAYETGDNVHLCFSQGYADANGDAPPTCGVHTRQ